MRLYDDEASTTSCLTLIVFYAHVWPKCCFCGTFFCRWYDINKDIYFDDDNDYDIYDDN